MSDIVTIRDMREIFSLPRAPVCYAVDRYGPEHSGRIGITRYWLRDDLPRIRESLRKTGALESVVQQQPETEAAG